MTFKPPGEPSGRSPGFPTGLSRVLTVGTGVAMTAMSEALVRLGLPNVYTAEDARAGLRQIIRVNPQAVVCRRDLEPGGGEDFERSVRAHPLVPDAAVPFVFVDAATTADAVAEALRRAVAPTTPSETDGGPAAREFSSLRALVVEDQEYVRFLICEAFRGLGCTALTEAADGEEGLEAVRRERPDVILCDLYMPRADGLEFLRRLRSEDDPQRRRIPVAVVTGDADKTTARRVIDAGADALLVKPITRAGLVACLRDMLSRTRG